MSPRRASRNVLPLFIDSISANSSRRSQSSSAILRINLPRALGFIFDHGPDWKARRAALTAKSTSLAEAAGASQIFSPVAGFMTGSVPPSIGSTLFPSISSLSVGSLGVSVRGSVMDFFLEVGEGGVAGIDPARLGTLGRCSMRGNLKRRRVLLLKAGEVSAAVRRSQGDYDRWFAEALQDAPIDWTVVEAQAGQPLPQNARAFDALVITGSPLSLTEREPW